MTIPVFQEITKARNLSIQEGKNREREEIISWLLSQNKKTVKIDDMVNYLKTKPLSSNN